jgi:acetyl/propionyl-CoA carboxylase alpha subunit
MADTESVRLGPAPAAGKLPRWAELIIDSQGHWGPKGAPGLWLPQRRTTFAKALEGRYRFRRPAGEAIAAMGDKIIKKLAAKAGVNVVPGYLATSPRPTRR